MLWKCDRCIAKIEKEGTECPEGWTTITVSDNIERHFCRSCYEAVLDLFPLCRPLSKTDNPIQRVLLTKEEVRSRGERIAQEILGVPFDEAIRQLDDGEWRGTIIEAELRGLQFLLGDR